MMTENSQLIEFKWDPKDVQVRTKSVQKALEPLVNKVTALMNTNGTSGLKKGRSKSAHVLALAIEKATGEFIVKGEQIAVEHPNVKNEMFAALNEVKATSETMQMATNEFSEDPCSDEKRGQLVRCSRELLSAVTKLLITADMIDVHILLTSLKIVRSDLEIMKKASSQQELASSFQTFGEDMMELDHKAYYRQIDLRDPRYRDDLASARATMKKNSMMLLTASKAFMSNPNAPEAKHNRDFAFEQMENAVNTIGNVTTATKPSEPREEEGIGFLAAAMDDFDRRCVVDPSTYNDSKVRPSLEKRLEEIISAAAHMADRPNTRDERRERIVNECNAVRQGLQDLLASYMENAGSGSPSESLEKSIDKLGIRTKGLRRQLRRAIVDHVSDTFAQADIPLLLLIETAKQENASEFTGFAAVFEEHAKELLQVAELACSMCNSEDGVKLVRYAMNQLESLCPQVMNASKMLCINSRNKVANENMDVFKTTWETQVRLLTEAIDDITNFSDFLSVSESHILDDVNKCVFAVQDKDMEQLDKTAAVVRGRASRICHVVSTEMDNFEPGEYTESSMQAVYAFRDNIMPHFSKTAEAAISTMSNNGGGPVQEDEFVDACRWVYDGVREIRKAVLANRAYDELDSDSEYEEDENGANDATVTGGGAESDEAAAETPQQRSRTASDYSHQSYQQQQNRTGRLSTEDSLEDQQSSNLQQSEMEGSRVDRAMMRMLPEEEKQQIAAEVAVFKQEKAKFDYELTTWDETGNDIITLAKQMCMIMMEMTDFTRGRGPLKTTMDVIGAAQHISHLGKTMVDLAGEIAEQCVQSRTKTDLQGYLKSIVLYTHQLNITSKVKTDITQIGGEMVLSGLESAISLITSAKNLMQAVVQTVKAAYVASTKYRSENTARPTVVWKVRAPDKKPLIKPIKNEDIGGSPGASVIRKESRHVNSPARELSHFGQNEF